MDQDLALVLGLVIGGFAIIGMLSAVSDGRGPRASAVTVLIAGCLITYALYTKPGGYTMAQMPDVFFRVLSRVWP